MKPERGYRATPADYGIIAREMTIATGDSITLRAWFYPAQDTAGIANDLVGKEIPVPAERRPPPRAYRPPVRGPRPTVVICSGDAGNMTYLIFPAYQLFTRGFNVLTFDWRGFGESAPWPLETDRLCATEFLTDYDAALDSLLRQPEVGRGGVGLLGFSTGAYLSFAEAARRPEVRAFAGRALLTSFDDLLPIITKLDPDRHWSAPPDYPRELLPVNAAKGLRVPALLVVGENDRRTPPWMSRRVAARLAGPKEVWVVPGAEHGGQKAPELAAYPEFFERLAAFFGKYLKGPPAR
jgi:pimeloyl-ACP methyl ester carboxylesterase